MTTKLKDMYKRSLDCVNMNRECGSCKWHEEAYSHCKLYNANGRFIGKPKKDVRDKNKGWLVCPECLGEMKDGKCVLCGWTPEFARVYKKLSETLKDVRD